MFLSKLSSNIIINRIQAYANKKVVRSLYFLLIFLLGLYVIYDLVFFSKIFPGVYVNNINVGGKSVSSSLDTLEHSHNKPKSLLLKHGGYEFVLNLDDIGASADLTKTSERAFNQYRSGNPFYNLGRFSALLNNRRIGFIYTFDEVKLNEVLSVIAGQIYIEPVNPSIKLEQGILTIEKGKSGKEVNKTLLKAKIEEALSEENYDNIEIPAFINDPSINDQQADVLKNKATKFIGKEIQLTYEGKKFEIIDETLVSFVSPKDGIQTENISREIEKISKEIDSPPQNPVFTFQDGKVREFLPAKDGVVADADLLKKHIISFVQDTIDGKDPVQEIVISVVQTPSDYKTEEVNDLGIKELIGKGNSEFAGSISSRIHNIQLAASHFNGVLIPPGNTFSFNEILGDVSSYTGYQQAYIIKDGKTVLGDGGGVCQVSTTLFRAALDAGLPIVERRAHSYRVGYYEQNSPPGIDATVYSPTTDLKIKNDTPNHILIQTITNTANKTLSFEIYGTSDGRTSTVTTPVVYDVSAPPEDLYVDDPNLSVGVIKQIDWKAWGAKVKFDYSVERDGETIFSETFYSNYRPWQSIYLRGTGPIPQ